MAIKDLLIEDILSSKVYVKPNSSVSFGTPKEYLEPFIEPIVKVMPEAAFRDSIQQKHLEVVRKINYNLNEE